MVSMGSVRLPQNKGAANGKAESINFTHMTASYQTTTFAVRREDITRNFNYIHRL